MRYEASAEPVDVAPPAPAASEESDPVRTALAVEPRGGLLHVFLPPL